MQITYDGKMTKELDNVAYFKAIVDKMAEIYSHIDQFTVAVKNMKLSLEDSCENKETITDIMDVSEHLRGHYAMQVTESQKKFTEQIKRHKAEMEQLKAYADIKIKEVDTLENRVNDQKLYINSYEKSMKCITDKVIIHYYFPYLLETQ